MSKIKIYEKSDVELDSQESVYSPTEESEEQEVSLVTSTYD